MRLNAALLSGCLSALIACAVPAWGVTVHECTPGKPTAASYTWDFKTEANTIFQDAQTDAQQAAYHADQLETLTRDSSLSWDSQAEQLDALKQDVNDFGTKALPPGDDSPRGCALATGRDRQDCQDGPADGG